MLVIQDHPFSVAKGGKHYTAVAKSFYGINVDAVLEKTQEYGKVLTMTELINYFPFSDDGLLQIVPVTVQSEEIVGRSRAGNEVVITVHGAGLLTPERIKNGINYSPLSADVMPDHGLTKPASGKGHGALPLKDEEVYALLDGKTPFGDIEVYSFSDLEKGFVFPTRYALVRDFDLEKEKISGKYYSLQELANDPRMICSAGSLEAAEAHLRQLAKRSGTEMFSNFHSLHNLDINQPQGRFLERRGFLEGLYGCLEMDGSARFVAVRKQDLEEKAGEQA